MAEVKLPLGLDLNPFNRSLREANNNIKNTLNPNSTNKFANSFRSVGNSINRNVLGPLGKLRGALSRLPAIGAVVAGGLSVAGLTNYANQAVAEVRKIEDSLRVLRLASEAQGKGTLFNQFKDVIPSLVREFSISEHSLISMSRQIFQNVSNLSEYKNELRNTLGVSRALGIEGSAAYELIRRATTGAQGPMSQLGISQEKVNELIRGGMTQSDAIKKLITETFGPAATDLINPLDQIRSLMNEMKVMIGEEIIPKVNDLQLQIGAMMKEYIDSGLQEDVQIVMGTLGVISDILSGIYGIFVIIANVVKLLLDSLGFALDIVTNIAESTIGFAIWLGSFLTKGVLGVLTAISLALVEIIELVLKGLQSIALFFWENITKPILDLLAIAAKVPGMGWVEDLIGDAKKLGDSFLNTNINLSQTKDLISELGKSGFDMTTVVGDQGFLMGTRFGQRFSDSYENAINSGANSILGMGRGASRVGNLWGKTDEGIQETVLTGLAALLGGPASGQLIRKSLMSGIRKSAGGGVTSPITGFSSLGMEKGFFQGGGGRISDYLSRLFSREKIVANLADGSSFGGVVGKPFSLPSKEMFTVAARIMGGIGVHTYDNIRSNVTGRGFFDRLASMGAGGYNNPEIAREVENERSNIAGIINEFASGMKKSFDEMTIAYTELQKQTHEIKKTQVAAFDQLKEVVSGYTSSLDDGMSVNVELKTNAPNRFRRARPRR
jgi:hypothetical protein